MQRLLRFGRFGSFYGSLSGAAFGVLVLLYVTVDTLSHWPKEGTVSWFLGGTFSMFLFLVIGGYVLGLIGGFVFGLVGSLARNSLGWCISGVIGGFVSSWFAVWLMWLMIRKPNPDFLSLWWSSWQGCVYPCIILGGIGWIVGRAIYHGSPNIPHLNWIRNQ